MLVDRTDIFGW